MQDLTPFQLFVCSSTLAIICLWTSSNQAQAQQPQQIPEQFTIQNPCVSKPTCHDCIQTPSCAWCSEPTFTNPRCFQPSYPTAPEDRCATKYIYNPDNEMGFISNLSLSRSRLHSQSGGGAAGSSGGGWGASGSSSGGSFGSSGGSFGSSGGSWEEGQGTTQITPQRISITLRARQSFSIQMYYTQAEDYPVDLYYLMDLSKSMEDDKEKLYKLGDHLVATMQNVTSKFTVGFGSFVDKVVMPYVSTLPEKLQHPCSGCVAPYGFRNHMTLSTNTKTFSHMVNEATVSGNLDAPEGGFDAIMQAVVCRKEIGWREKARRLLVFSTDAGFHYAGDGKLGGIVKPNDGRCHLDQRGYYTMSSLQDYPSISQINLYVKRNAINVIFAVTSDKIDIYKQLQSHIEGASCGTLSNDSSNIVELIKEQYEAISSTVEMKHNASSAVGVRFFTKCLNSNGPMTETGKCGSIKVGDLIEFRIELEVLKCPKDPADWKQTIQIYPVGINESLIIDLTMLCSCPCEQPGDPLYVPNSEVCHGAGTYMCGTCQCHPNSFGRFCECQKNAVTTSSNITMNCKSPLNNLECSGRGTCLCGECACEVRNRQNEHVYGDYCECDDFSCARHNGKLCSGPEHGRCDCGKCVCTNDWTRDDCSCPVSQANCFAPGVENGTVCSGNGVCECGVCKCNVTESGRFSGKFCETCPTCESKCDTYKACVQCHVYGTGPYSEKECNTNCTEFVPIRAKVIEVDEKNNENLCAYYDEDDCRFTFVYYYKDKAIAIRALEERECPPEVFLLGIVFGVIAAVVLMGLAILLLWKLLTTIHDRREFARFEKERMMAKWDTGENPIYKQATSTFKNPTYAGKG